MESSYLKDRENNLFLIGKSPNQGVNEPNLQQRIALERVVRLNGLANAY